MHSERDHSQKALSQKSLAFLQGGPKQLSETKAPSGPCAHSGAKAKSALQNLTSRALRLCRVDEHLRRSCGAKKAKKANPLRNHVVSAAWVEASVHVSAVAVLELIAVTDATIKINNVEVYTISNICLSIYICLYLYQEYSRIKIFYSRLLDFKVFDI